MVFFKDIFKGRPTSILFLYLVLSIVIGEAWSTRIAYTKPLNGRTRIFRPKLAKRKIFEDRKFFIPTPTPEKAFLEPPMEIATSVITNPCTSQNLDFAESIHSLKTYENAEDKIQDTKVSPRQSQLLKETATEDTPKEDIKTESTDPLNKYNSKVGEEHKEQDTKEDHNRDELTATAVNPSKIGRIESLKNEARNPNSASTNQTQRLSPCTCGIFMNSQVKRSKNGYEPPEGKPVISNELDRIFPCNAIGQKQCQTKCLETIVQHLPNSANILCATLDRDIRKERAYLFIKNCRKQWHNTNLAAGREYCCKNGQPYQCPMV